MFDELTIRGVTFRNRVWMSPMCMYAAEDGVPGDWHLAHYTTRAMGGAGAVIVEATAIEPGGRITPGDVGLWNDAQQAAHRRIAASVSGAGAVPGVQLAHAGRRAGRTLPWEGNLHIDEAAWGQRVSATATAYSDDSPVPQAMDADAIAGLIAQFAESARRAIDAGYRMIELHFAHGYLIHQFISPLTNQRDDAYGIADGVQIGLAVEIARAVRAVVGGAVVISARLSVVDWVPGGLTLAHSVRLARALGDAGVDMIDCSSGALVRGETIPVAPGYHAPFARAMREEAGLASALVGLVTTADEARRHLEAGDADVVLLGRALLRDPYWVARAYEAQAGKQDLFPRPYRRALGGMTARSVW